jgi:hypothetical protein
MGGCYSRKSNKFIRQWENQSKTDNEGKLTVKERFVPNYSEFDHKELNGKVIVCAWAISDAHERLTSLSLTFGIEILDSGELKALTTLKESLAQLTKLERLELHFSSCRNLNDAQMVAIISSIAKMDNLKTLYLSLEKQDKISDVTLVSLHETLVQLRNLNTFSLEIDNKNIKNAISTAGLATLSQSFKAIPKLTSLHFKFLCKNHMIKEGWIRTFENIAGASKLLSLDIVGNDIPHEAWQALIQSFTSLQELTSLKIGTCSERDYFVAGALRGLPRLQELIVNDDNLDYKIKEMQK